MSESDRKEIEQFLMLSEQTQAVQRQITNLTATAFSKCIDFSRWGSPVDDRDSQCIRNVVNRYLDAQIVFRKRLQEIAQADR